MRTRFLLEAVAKKSGPVFGCLSHLLDACFAGFPAHSIKPRIWGKLWNRPGEILVEGVAAFLLDFPGFRRRLITVAVIETWFFHKIYFLFRCFSTAAAEVPTAPTAAINCAFVQPNFPHQ
jgi:hypothetical protein